MTTHAAVEATSRAERQANSTVPPGAIVTPEGVLLQYSPVGIGSRIVSRIVDTGIQFGVLLGAITVIGVIGPALSEGAVFALFAVTGFATIFVYPVAMEMMGGRRTFGHRAANIKIVSLDGGPLRFRQAAIRAMMLLIDLFATSGFAGAAAILSSERGQRLGDLAAGTMAVRLPSRSLHDLAADRPQFTRRLPLEMDLRRLTDDEIDVAMALLSRGGELSGGAQLHLARTMSDRFAQRLGVKRPESWTYGEHLQAVVEARAAAGSHRVGT